MRNMDSETNIGCRTIREVKRAAKMLEMYAEDAGLLMAGGVKGRKAPSQAAVISALILWAEHQPEAAKGAAIRDGMERLNAYLEERPQPPSHAGEDMTRPAVAPPEPVPDGKSPPAAPRKRRRGGSGA